MNRDEWQTSDNLGPMLDLLRGRVDPLVARRFACACVRGIWSKVVCQRHVSDALLAQCCRAVELTERSLAAAVPDADLKTVDFDAITDAGDEAFMAAAHVGWNLFAPLHGLHPIDEFENAIDVASLAAHAGGVLEHQCQVALLRELEAYPEDAAVFAAGVPPERGGI